MKYQKNLIFNSENDQIIIFLSYFINFYLIKIDLKKIIMNKIEAIFSQISINDSKILMKCFLNFIESSDANKNKNLERKLINIWNFLKENCLFDNCKTLLFTSILSEFLQLKSNDNFLNPTLIFDTFIEYFNNLKESEIEENNLILERIFNFTKENYNNCSEDEKSSINQFLQKNI